MNCFTIILCLLVAVLSYHVVQSEGDYMEVDGIEVLKSDYEAAQKAQHNLNVFSHQSERDIEDILEDKEHPDVARALPKLCHVCRLFVENFMKFLQDNATVIAKDSEESAEYLYNEHFAYEGFEAACNGMKGYRITRLDKFRYVKEASILRQVFNEYQAKSKAKHWAYSIPESQIDDPTGEIKRLEEQCIGLKTKYRQSLLAWYEHHQDSLLIDWFCKKIYLKNENQDCLTEIKVDPLKKKEEISEEILAHNEL